MNIEIFQKGFNYSQDGPGNRMVYHMQGCNMHCPWCANPEGMKSGDGIITPVTVLIEEVIRSKSMFFDGGGVTFTGGEPTTQFDALVEMLTELKARNINTALETNASHSRLPDLFGKIDHLIMDLKSPWSDKYAHIADVSIDTIVQNIKQACLIHPSVTIRIPIVNHYNVSNDDVIAFAEILSDIVTERAKIELLRYHEYGREKWNRLGRTYNVSDGFVTDEQIRIFTRIFSEYGLNFIHT